VLVPETCLKHLKPSDFILEPAIHLGLQIHHLLLMFLLPLPELADAPLCLEGSQSAGQVTLPHGLLSHIQRRAAPAGEEVSGVRHWG